MIQIWYPRSMASSQVIKLHTSSHLSQQPKVVMGGSATWYTMSTSDTTTAPRMPGTSLKDPMGCWMWSMQSAFFLNLSNLQLDYNIIKILRSYANETANALSKLDPCLCFKLFKRCLIKRQPYKVKGPTHCPPNQVPLVLCDINDEQIIMVQYGSRVSLWGIGRSLFALGACQGLKRRS